MHGVMKVINDLKQRVVAMAVGKEALAKAERLNRNHHIIEVRS